MDRLFIEKTRFTPHIDFALEHPLVMQGESYPENTAEFYAPVMAWLKQALAEEGNLILNMEIIYFNSSSSKVFLDLFDTLEDAAKDGKNITVNWIYDAENDSALEYGEEFKEDLEHLTFNLVCK
ncbi:MAG: DUF1987 domain-containing protein [SAR324 cluster bacterium]|nr:DUF1987 domain-containing protein [SAR324 cluster bacterium]